MVNHRPHLGGGGGAPGGFLSWTPHRLKWRGDFFLYSCIFYFSPDSPKIPRLYDLWSLFHLYDLWPLSLWPLHLKVDLSRSVRPSVCMLSSDRSGWWWIRLGMTLKRKRCRILSTKISEKGAPNLKNRGRWGKLVAFFRKRYISKLKAHFCTLSTLAGVAIILLLWLGCTYN